MKRGALFVMVLAVAAVLPATALAKGASEAEITGPGLSGPIELSGSGEPGSGEELGAIAEAAGFFAAVFGQSPDPMLAERPQGALGPRYTIAYVMPGPAGEEDTLLQDVYPYAKPHPVTYTKPGQPFWTTERTQGGWYVASYSGLGDLLVSAGLPSSPPSGGGDGGGAPWVLVGSLLGAAAIAGVGVLVVRAGRQRARAAHAG
jgi:hypothetical protein